MVFSQNWPRKVAFELYLTATCRLQVKGKAAGWQSTLQNSRIPECVSAFSKVILNVPEEEKEEIVDEIKEEIQKLSRAMISLRADRFAKWPDAEEKIGFSSDIASIFGSLLQFLRQTGVIIPLNDLTAPIATTINQAVVKAYKEVIFPDYNGDPNDSDDRASKYEWQRYIERIGFCTDLIKQAIDLCDEDEENDISRYENLIFFHEKAIESCSWDYKYTDYGKSWYKEWTLTDESKATRRKWISEYQSKVREIKANIAAKEAAERAEKARIEKEAADKRYCEYWEEHSEVKTRLEAEKKVLEAEIASLNSEIRTIPERKEKENIQERIKTLTAEKEALGFFKGKEKKNLQDQIDAASAELRTITDKISIAESAINRKISPLQNKLDITRNELFKPR